MPTCMFGHPPYVWIPPICLDTTHMFGCPHMVGYLHMSGHPSYVWMSHCMFGHPHIFGWPHTFLHLHMLRCPPYLSMPHTFGSIQTYGGVQIYREHPYIQGASKHMIGVQTWGIQTYGGMQTEGACRHMVACKNKGVHPNIEESKHTGAIQMYGVYGHLLSLTKHAFFVLHMYRGIQKYGAYMLPVCLDAPICWIPPCMLDTPICLDAPCVFRHPHMFGCPS